MDKREMKITIGKDGNVSYEVKGVKGEGCKDLTKFLDDALGEVKSSDNTTEFYEGDVQINQWTNG